MRNRTLIDGVTYKINGGKTLVEKTLYDVKSGKTLIEGAEYDVMIEKNCLVAIKSLVPADYQIAKVIIDGEPHTGETLTEIIVPEDTNIEYQISRSSQIYKVITINNETIKNEFTAELMHFLDIIKSNTYIVIYESITESEHLSHIRIANNGNSQFLLGTASRIFPEGASWKEFCESTFNLGGMFECVDGKVSVTTGSITHFVRYDMETVVSENDKIVPLHAYLIL